MNTYKRRCFFIIHQLNDVNVNVYTSIFTFLLYSIWIFIQHSIQFEERYFEVYNEKTKNWSFHETDDSSSTSSSTKILFRY